MLAAAVALHSVQLATNTNGALLLTWFLDTCTFPRRRSILAPRLVSHLVHLCTHKVAYLTVLKIINQRSEPEARDLVIQALFFSKDQTVLQDILSDQTCGATFVFKVLTTPFLDEKLRPVIVENVRNVLLRLKAQPQQGYKRLMDEVGLSTRHAGTPGSREASRTRSASRGRMPGGQVPHLNTQGGYGIHQGPMDSVMGGSTQRTASVDSSAYDPYGVGSYTHSPALSNMTPITPLQYQQAMLAQQQAAVANAQRQGNFYSSPTMPMNGFGSPTPSMDPFGRSGMTGSPLHQPHMGMSPGPMQGGFPQPGFSPMMNMGGYQYPVGYYPQQPQQQQSHVGNQRRGRVSPRNTTRI